MHTWRTLWLIFAAFLALKKKHVFYKSLVKLINRVINENVGIDHENSLVGEEFARFIVKTEEPY